MVFWFDLSQGLWQRRQPIRPGNEDGFNPKRELTAGDVVLLVEPNAKLGEWPLGRVVETYRGDDDLIRVVKIKVGDTDYIRPVHRLCPLERQ